MGGGGADQNQGLVAVAIAHGPVRPDTRPASWPSGRTAAREAAVRSLPSVPEVLLVDTTGRDHPRRAGLALHLGARLDVPSIGVTDRPLLASGAWPPDEPGTINPLHIQDKLVGYWVRPKRGVQPLAVHTGWRTDPETAISVVLSVTSKSRTPEPLR